MTASAPTSGTAFLLQSAVPEKLVIDRSTHSNSSFSSIFAQRTAETIYSWSQISDRFNRIETRYRSDAILFFRHGSTIYNERNLVSGQHNTRLSQLGRNQARELRCRLPAQIDVIVCSALVRAIETMQISVPIEQQKNADIAIDARLNEVNLGVLQGRRRRHLPEFDQGDLDFAPRDGESYRQAAQRVLSLIVDVFDRLAEREPSPRNAAVFCHAGVLRIVTTLARQGTDPKEVFKKSLDNTEQFFLSARTARLPTYWMSYNGYE